MELQGTTGLLTGAGGGIGTAVAARLADAGVRLVLTGRSEATLEELKAGLPGEGHLVLTADLSDREQSENLISRVEAAAGPIDLLVNNAGIEVLSMYDDLDTADLERAMEVNLIAPMLLTRAVVPGMLERQRGHVVQMSSIAGLMGTACNEPYAASKGGLIKFTESLRASYVDEPVGFTTVCPGFSKGGGMYTRMEEAGGTSNKMMGTTTVEHVADAVVKGISRDLPLLVCNNRPVRPLAALVPIAPRLAARMLDLGGANRLFRKLAAQRKEG